MKKKILNYPKDLITEIFVDKDISDLKGATRGTIEWLLDSLTEREAEVIRMRFGAYEGKRYTLDEVAAKFGVTRERIRQIEAKGIRKLRHSSRSRYIRYGIKELYEQEIESLKIQYENKIGTNILDRLLEDFDLPIRAYNCLKRSGLNTLNDVIEVYKSGELYKVKNLGRKCYKEVEDIIKEYVSINNQNYDKTNYIKIPSTTSADELFYKLTPFVVGRIKSRGIYNFKDLVQYYYQNYGMLEKIFDSYVHYEISRIMTAYTFDEDEENKINFDINEIQMSSRLHNSLYRSGLKTFQDILQSVRSNQYIRIRNLGEVSQKELLKIVNDTLIEKIPSYKKAM